MRNVLLSIGIPKVFLNYPFDDEFTPFAYAVHFGVVAAGLVPICARDLAAPDRPRLEVLMEAITNCQYSIHDLSKLKGEGEQNLARSNMPLEMGMALFHALQTQRSLHRCAIFVPTPHEYKKAISDLGGLDPICYEGDELTLVGSVYDWLRDTIAHPSTKRLSTVTVQERFSGFTKELKRIKGSGRDNGPTHGEAQELMFSICSKCKWWAWRSGTTKMLFPTLPLAWKRSTRSVNNLHPRAGRKLKSTTGEATKRV